MTSLLFLTKSLSLFVLLTLLHGCAAPLTTREKGVLAGGALGAGSGAIIGNQVGHQGAGAAIGGAFGALSGGLIGDQMYGQEIRQNAQAYQIEQQRSELERQRLELEQLRGQRRYDSYEPNDADRYGQRRPY
jgi:uncharacterized protein YcfJ